ncbi:MAG: MBL fold metallo-hydrolase [Chloroflexi bacterium]|nr:MBL fold metallo-hydrolase [Chloroflexota bacterium]
MNVIPFVHEGLGNSSYLVELGEGEAALVDPDRVARRYLQAAEERGWRISTILETHLHADFVSGARDVAEATGARIFGSAGAEYRFPHHGVAAGERIQSGHSEIEVIGSPGHTPEHISYVLRSERRPPALFSGGSLIVGGAARTDLISPQMTDELTRAQYRTLQKAFTSLPDETALYPTHGGGSFCSIGAGGDRVSTLGEERATNPVLAFEEEDEFSRWFPTTFPAAPDYFFRMRPINQQGPRLSQEIAPPPALPPDEFDRARQQGLVIDVRPIAAYAEAHIPGSLSDSLRDDYATWLGWLVPPDTRLLFVIGDESLQRVVEQSMLVGYERFAGWLEGGIEAWTAAGKPVEQSALVDAEQARKALLSGAIALDVREPAEVQAGRIEGAIDVPLGTLEANVDHLPKDRPIVAYCGHGERAATAISILERAGFEGLLNLDGGFEAWKEASYPVA